MKSPLEGDGDGEGRAGAGRAGPPELALVLLDDLAADGQAEAGALRLRGEELLEQAAADLRRNAGPRIAHGDLHGIVQPPGRHGQRPPLGHRLDPVLDQDRKSTRLNSSHVKISYAVFCLK